MKQYSPESRPHQTHMQIAGGECVTTDGARLHLFTHKGKYEDGLYLITICRCNLVQLVKSDHPLNKFPKYKGILDTKNYYKLDQTFTFDKYNFSLGVFFINREGVMINPYYLLDLGPYIFDVYITNDKEKLDSKALILQSGNKTAAIMPIRFT